MPPLSTVLVSAIDPATRPLGLDLAPPPDELAQRRRQAAFQFTLRERERAEHATARSREPGDASTARLPEPDAPVQAHQRVVAHPRMLAFSAPFLAQFIALEWLPEIATGTELRHSLDGSGAYRAAHQRIHPFDWIGPYPAVSAEA